MKTFANYLERRQNIESGTPVADMRVARPPHYGPEQEAWLIRQLQNPANREQIAKVLKENPSLVQTLTQMIKNSVINTDTLFGRGEGGMATLNQLGTQAANNIIPNLIR